MAIKLNTKAFKGTETVNYWVTHYVASDGHISLVLNMKFRGTHVEADSIHSSSFLNKDSDFQSFEERLEYVLNEAKTIWDLELTNTDLKVAI